MKFKISVDTQFFTYNSNNKYGIFFYGKRINDSMSEKEFNQIPIQSYKVKLVIREDKRIKPKDVFPYEEIEFIATFNINDFIVEEKSNKYYSKQFTIDYDKIVNEFFDKDYLEFLKERLKRRIENKHKEPTYFKDVYNDDAEFLEFDDSAYEWGGPHEYNDLLGCAMDLKYNDKVSTAIDLDFTKIFQTWLLPRQYNNLSVNGKTLLDNYEKKLKFLNKIPKKDLLETFNKTMEILLDSEGLLNFYKYKIFLYGTDDCSYTKGFHTEEEMMEEAQRLRNTQPLNMSLDIIHKGYIFTN